MELSELHGQVLSEGVNKNLDSYTGTVRLSNGIEEPLDGSNVLYRGSQLVTAKHIFGFILFTGKQTKLMKNMIKPRLKRTKMDKMLNRTILLVSYFLLVGCLLFFVDTSGFFLPGFHYPFRCMLAWCNWNWRVHSIVWSGTLWCGAFCNCCSFYLFSPSTSTSSSHKALVLQRFSTFLPISFYLPIWSPFLSTYPWKWSRFGCFVLCFVHNFVVLFSQCPLREKRWSKHSSSTWI